MITARRIAGAIAVLGSIALLATGIVATTPPVAGSEKGEITIAVFNGWDEGIAASELWSAILESKGYDVELVYADVAAAYVGVSSGDYDLILDTWLPTTHAQYMETYGDKVVDLGAWNDEAKLTIAVNADAPIDSLSELAANADLFGNQLIGIEAGSGLVTITEQDVIPGYGLEGMDFVVSSTPAMLSELKAKTAAGENVAVTLWRPHWAYNAFPIKDLEDPEGLLGDAESIHTIASTSLAGEHPEVEQWLSEFRMDNDLLYSLEDAMFNSDVSDDYSSVVAQWIADNQEWVDSLMS